MLDTEVQPSGGDTQFRILDYSIYRMNPAGIVTSWNTGSERAKGYSASEIIGQDFAVFFTSEDQADGKPAQALAAALANTRFEGEIWQVRKDGSRFLANVAIDEILNENGLLIGFIKTTHDLTGRALQDVLRQTERRFRLLMESVVHYAIYTLDNEGRMTSWNPGAERAKGYTRDEVMGKSFSLFFTPEDRAMGKPAKCLAAAVADRRFEEDAWRGPQGWHSILGKCRHRTNMG